ncbi:hypothetical protein [Mycoplasma seminis]|uniref:DUF2975 domain-containing protein n=1 Tax=Mycoplasma seminis TaxID=512749 RepID=A0ABY9HBT4_9MOLU|nr:hypothetical protein [Mycoplasma seminis]WLP85664.1 hypothetical protein Q8852_00685 [Mycoplasma seminis]
MTNQLKYKFKLSFLIIYNILTISLFLGFVISVLYFGIKSKIEPNNCLIAANFEKTPSNQIESNQCGGYIFNEWYNLWGTYLGLAIAFYALQLAYLLVLKNKILHCLFPILYIKKINLDNKNKIIFIIFSILAWMLFIGLIPIFVVPFWWMMKEIIQSIVAVIISCLLIILFTIVWGIELNDFIKNSKSISS